ncbi:MAG: T9SS type A sorting domain-containing protein, partial [Bacteroidia bacterium]
FASPFGSTFFLGQLAPNGKIYWSCTNGENVLHVINQPDSLGSACDFQQHGIQLLSYNAFGLPNHPNYYLGAKVGSACDTLGLSNQEAVNSKQIKIYPNPARDRLQLESSEVLQKGTFVLYNLAGQAMLRQEVFGNAAEINVEDMAAGMYFYRIFEGNKVIAYGKVVIE